MLRNILVVLRGTALAQIIGVAALPIITRGFAPEALGHFQAFQSILTVALVISSFRYEIAILRASSQDEVEHLLVLSLLLNLVVAGLSVGGLAIYRSLAVSSKIVLPNFLFWCLPTALLLGGITQTLSYRLTREHRYAANANTKIGQSIANAGTAGGMAITFPISAGIVIADIVGRLVAVAMMARATKILTTQRPHATWAELKGVASRFCDLPLVSLPAALFNTLGSIVTPLMIYYAFNASTSGQFGLTERAMSLPIALIVIAVSQVYMAHLADEIRKSDGDPRRYFRRLTLILGAISVIPAIIGIFAAPTLFRLVFGPGWEQAAAFARLMIPAYWLALISGSINMTLTVIGRTSLQLVWDAMRLAAMALLWTVAPTLDWSVYTIVGIHAAITGGFALVLIAMSYAALPRTGTLAALSAEPGMTK